MKSNTNPTTEAQKGPDSPTQGITDPTIIKVYSKAQYDLTVLHNVLDCTPDELEDCLTGYRFDEQGVYKDNRPLIKAGLTDDEQAAIYQGYAGQLHALVLKLPCSGEELYRFCERSGCIPADGIELVDGLPEEPEQMTPADYVAVLRSEGKTDAVIAVLLGEKYPAINGYEKYRLINPQRVEVWERLEEKSERAAPSNGFMV